MQLLVVPTGMASLALVGMSIDWIGSGGDVVALPPLLARLSPSNPASLMLLLGGTILALEALRAWLTYRHSLLVARVIHRELVPDMQSRVFGRLQHLSLRFYDANRSGSIINRVTSDVQSLRQFVDGVVLQLVVLLLTLAFYLVYMLSIHVRLTLLCLVVAPLLWLVATWFSRVVRPAYDRSRHLVDLLVLRLAETARASHVVRGFARQDAEIAKFTAANERVRAQQNWIFHRVSVFTPSTEFLTQLSLALLLAYGGYLVVTRQIALGAGLIVFSRLLQQFATQVTKMTQVVNSMQQSMAGARRVFDILEAPVEIDNRPDAVRLPRAAGALRFDRVSFGYAAGRTVLHEIDLAIEPGETVVITGPTGAGKSTLLALVSRFYDPTAGRVIVDDSDVRQLDLHDLRRNVGLVFQESFLFGDTVAANIAFGCPEATPSQIERAARLASAHDFISRLPDGYDTVLDEGGANLSGGQRQRLAIARALLLEPPILLLDDPTAALDSGTERDVLRAVEGAMQGRTTLLVSNRPSVLARADRVVVLDGGRVVETYVPEPMLRLPERRTAVLQFQVA